MASHNLSLETLKQLDLGKVQSVFDALLKQAVADIADRPLEKKPRTITMKLHLSVGDLARDGTLDKVIAAFDLGLKLPQMATAEYPLLVGRDGNLRFNSEAPDDPTQMTLDEEEARKEEETD